MNKIITTIIISIISLIPQIILYSQTWEFLGGPTGRKINDIAFTKTERLLCSDDKTVYYSDDFGATWRESISARRFSGVHRLTTRINGEIIAIASYNIIKSTDNGVNWFAISNHSYLHHYGASIFESPIDSALYFVKDKSLYKSTNGGYSWNIIWNSNDVIDCMTIDEKGWIFMSERYRRILVSKDNGNLFTHFPFSMNLSNSIISGIYSDKNDGYYFYIDDKTYHYRYAVISNIAGFGEARILGVDDYGNALFKIGNTLYTYLLTVKNFYPISSPSFLSSNFIRRIITKGSKWVANVSAFGVFCSSNAGKDWTSSNIGLSSVEGTAIHVTNNFRMILSAFTDSFWGNLYLSDNNGENWYQQNPPKNPVFFDIEQAQNGNLIAIGSYGIFVSNNNGLNWVNPIDSDIGSKIFVSKKGYIYCGTYPKGLYISTDNGNNWFKPNNFKDAYFISFGESSSGRLFATEIYRDYKLYYSDDNGMNWTQHNQNFTELYYILTKGDSIFLSASSGVYLSIDNGISWERISYTWIGKMFLTPNGELLGIHYGGKRLYKSTNNGKDWFYWDDEIKNKNIRDLCFDNEYRLYALTDSGIFISNYYIKISNTEPPIDSEHLHYLVKLSCEKFQSAVFYKFELYADSISSSTKREYHLPNNTIFIESLLPDKTYYWRAAIHSERLGVFYSDFSRFKTLPELTLSQNYPNPFNAGTTIHFKLPHKTKVKISVYNSLGEFLEVITEEEFSHGDHIIKWNGNKYPSGVYIINIRGDYFNDNLKAILIK